MARSLEEIRAYQIAWYHRTKHRRGIRDRVPRTAEEKRLKAREGERRRYREERARLGKSVRLVRAPGTRTPKVAHQQMLDASRRYRETHRERKRASAREWARRNRHKGQRRFVERYHSDPAFNLAIKVRRRIHMALRAAHIGKSSSTRIIDLLGCSYRDLRVYIEAQFVDGMTWEGLFDGSIHLDHRAPCSVFNLLDEQEQHRCFHWSNLQPLWAKDNLSKRARLDWVPVV